MNKTAQLQIRVSPDQKRRIKSQANQAGEDVSQWVLRRLLPECADELQGMIDTLSKSPKLRSQVLAELHDFLVSSDSAQLGQAFNTLDLSHLKVFVARPEYLLAMKCLAMRLGEEFHDESDIRFLLRYLNISMYQVAIDLVAKYYPVENIPQKTLYALEEILEA